MPLFPKSLFLSVLLLYPLPAFAQDLSAEIAAQGLAATETRLAALAAPSEADRFALGGIRFLRALETTFQTRYRTGMDDPTGMIPLIRLNQGIAPDARIAPADVAALVTRATTDLAAGDAGPADGGRLHDKRIVLVDAGVWFPPGPIRRHRVLVASLGCDAAILVRRADRQPSPARETVLAAVGVTPLGEVLTFAPAASPSGAA